MVRFHSLVGEYSLEVIRRIDTTLIENTSTSVTTYSSVVPVDTILKKFRHELGRALESDGLVRSDCLLLCHDRLLLLLRLFVSS